MSLWDYVLTVFPPLNKTKAFFFLPEEKRKAQHTALVSQRMTVPSEEEKDLIE